VSTEHKAADLSAALARLAQVCEEATSPVIDAPLRDLLASFERRDVLAYFDVCRPGTVRALVAVAQAAVNLREEVSALRIAEHEIVTAMGRVNWNVLMLRLRESGENLAALAAALDPQERG
jgi:hypothetical protein